MAGAPEGCGPAVSSLYYNLCDLTTVWGVVTEAVAAAGVAASLVLFVILVASLPLVTDRKRKATVVLQAGVLTFTLGLFGLTFAFIVGRYSASCAARRFLFGVLFAGCLACLTVHGLWLLLLGRWSQGPRSWILCLGALAVWLVEVIINAEWLIVTLVRSPAGSAAPPDVSCGTANLDFVLSLIYVMVLLLAAVLTPFPALAHKRWRQDAAFILATGMVTMAIWIGWILMYAHGNRAVGDPSWDDPTLAVAVVTNAWVFLCCYTIPEICLLTKEDPYQEDPQDLVHPPRSLVYGSVRKEAEAAHQHACVENRAFSMDEAPAGVSMAAGLSSSSPVPTKPVSPYGAFNGQVRGCVYQPTEIALIAKGLMKMDQDTMIPRARTPTMNPGSGGSLPRPAGPPPTRVGT